MGAARGIDEGLIAGVFDSKHFQNLLGIAHESPEELASIKGNVVAMVNIGSVGGAFLYDFSRPFLLTLSASYPFKSV